MPVTAASKLCLWRDSVLYLGDSFDPETHSHHAVQCCIALEGNLRIRWPGVETWQSCRAAVIGANVSHSIANPDGPLCLLYLEKTSNNFRSIMDYHCVTFGCDIRAEPLVLQQPVSTDILDTLRAARLAQVTPQRAEDLKQTCLQLFHGNIAEPLPLDPRIAKILVHLHQDPGTSFTGSELADIACLSPSRMQHLFKQQIGIPVRKYILWTRLRHVLELALGGTPLTTSSHQSGFSDSAHFSRTFRSMFGLAPSLLLTANTGLTPVFCG